MKQWIGKVGVLLLVAALAPQVAVAQLTNGGFEDGLDAWNQRGAVSVEQHDADDPAAGHYALLAEPGA